MAACFAISRTVHTRSGSPMVKASSAEVCASCRLWRIGSSGPYFEKSRPVQPDIQDQSAFLADIGSVILELRSGGVETPERNDQFACQRDDHCLARATTAIGGAGAIPQCQRALLLKHQKAPGELDHGAADPGVAGSGEPLFAAARAAVIRRAC